MFFFSKRFLAVSFLLLAIGIAIALYYQKAKQPIQREQVAHSKKEGSHFSEKENKQTKHATFTKSRIPKNVYVVLEYIKQYDEAPKGYVGGRIFKNKEGKLDRQTSNNHVIYYQEWDVHPKSEQHNRGRERLVTGSDGRAWFTKDHYNTFVEVK